GQVRNPLQGRVWIAGYGDGFRAAAASVFESGDREWSSPAGRNSHNDVVLTDLPLCHFPRAQAAGIFTRFHGSVQRTRAPGNHELYQLWIHSKRRRTFGGVQRTQAAAGASPNVDQAPSFPDSLGNPVDRLGDLWQGSSNRSGYFAVFPVDNAGNLQRGLAIQVGRREIRSFGRQAPQIFLAPLQRTGSSASMTAS